MIERLDGQAPVATGVDHLFGYPDVGRFGLAHSLMAWGRCLLWCQRSGATMLAPIWLRPRLGPYLRRERDKREYFRLFHAGEAVGGLPRLWRLAFSRQLSAENELPPAGFTPDRPTVVVFRNSVAANDQTFFHHLRGEGELIRRELTRITRAHHRPTAPGRPFIAVHVRMGDFGQAASLGELNAGKTNQRIPLAWSVEMVGGLRERVGGDVPVILFSDGSDQELAALLALPGVRRSPAQAAITDMLAIAQAGALVSSGSGFCRWGSYMGQVPRICFPGQRIVGVLDDESLEPDCGSPADIPATFLAAVASRLRTGHAPPAR